MKFDKSLFKNLKILLSGSIVSQLISILCSPILTRIYGAENLGIYTYVLSVAAILMPIINLRYDMSIVTSEDNNLFPLIKGNLIVGSIMSIFATLCYGLYIIVISKNFELRFTIPFFLFILLSYSLINIFTAFNNRQKHYRTISQVTIIRSFIQNVGSVLLGMFSSKSVILIFLYTVGQFAGVRKQSEHLNKKFRLIIAIPLKRVIDSLKIEYRQALYSTPASFFNGLSYSIITVFIEKLYGFSSVGYYSMSVRMLGIPLSLISTNLSRIFFERASKKYSAKKDFYVDFKLIFLIQLVMAVPLVLFLITFAPSLFALFFGNDWRIAGNYVAILAPMFGLRFIVTTVSPALIIVNKQKVDLFLQFLFIISVVIIYVISLNNELSIESFLNLINVFFSIVYTLYLFFVFKYSKQKEKKND